MAQPQRPPVTDPRKASGTRPRAPLGLPSPGQVIAGKYRIVRVIGEGAMGVVFEATHLRLRQRLAIKVLRPDVRDSDTVLARFEREARASAQLRSMHTARVIDVDTLENGLPYIVLEYLEGSDLDAELRAVGCFPVEDAADIALQVAGAMAEAHDLGIVHRDLKPANLFVCHAGERRVIKILDFGISRDQRDEARITATDQYFGTPAYAAPEQLTDAASADARSDVWSLGIVLYELLTGRTPFEGTPTQVIAKVMVEPVPWPKRLRGDIPADLARVVMRCLEREPARRFRGMRELAQALAPFGPRQPTAALVADVQRPRGRLGEILVSDGLLAQTDLERALDEQQRTGKLLGRVLLDMGLVAQPDLLTALAKQQGLFDPAPARPPTPPDPERAATTLSRSRPSPSPAPSRRPVPRWIAALLVAIPIAAVLCALGARFVLP
jgi:serine/threonine protein kinase